jgi:hypothetical protein
MMLPAREQTRRENDGLMKLDINSNSLAYMESYSSSDYASFFWGMITSGSHKGVGIFLD